MIICASEFDNPDPKNPSYSLDELDYYSRIPLSMRSEAPDHMLFMRKNLKTEEFELCRKYSNPQVAVERANAEGNQELMLRGFDVYPIEVIYSGSLEAVMEKAYEEELKFWGHANHDTLCTHEGKKRALFCAVKPYGNSRTRQVS